MSRLLTCLLPIAAVPAQAGVPAVTVADTAGQPLADTTRSGTDGLVRLAVAAEP